MNPNQQYWNEIAAKEVERLEANSATALGAAKAPLINALNILHIKTQLNVSHGTPPKK